MNPKLISLVVVSGLLLPLSGDYSLESLRAEPAANEAEKPAQDKEFKPKIRVAKETTHVLGPLDKDGYVDFVEAVNERISKGVTPENNAAVPLLQAIGPECFAKELREEYFRRIGMKPLPEDGKYFVDFREFIKRNRQWLPPKLDSDDENDTTQREEILEQQFDEAQARPWSREEFPAIAAWLEANEKSLALVEKASRRSQYFVPYLRKGDGALFLTVELGHVQSLRQIARALVIRAMLRLHENDAAGAWRDSLVCHKLGRLSSRSATTVEYVVAHAIERMASSTEAVIVEHIEIDARRGKEMIKTVRELPPLSDLLELVDFGERMMMLDGAQGTALYGFNNDAMFAVVTLRGMIFPRNPRLYNWNIVMKASNDWFDRLVNIMRVEDATDREAEMSALSKELEAVLPGEIKQVIGKAVWNLTSPYARSRSLGDVYARFSLPLMRILYDVRDREAMQGKITETAIALAAYKRERGKYPDRLVELAPDILDKVPLDSFTGKDLVYRKTETGYILYSVGPNLQDDGGTSAEEADGYDFDLVVRVPSKRAAASE